MLEFIILIILLAFTVLTAASETAIIAVSRIRLRRLSSGGSKTARIILNILETPERFFSTILVANSVVNTMIAAVVTVSMTALIGETKGVIAATILVSVLIIIFEVVSKTLAAVYSEKMSFLLVKPVSMLIFVLSPLVNLLAKVTNYIINCMGGSTRVKPTLVTEDEIRAIIKIGEEDGVLHKEKFKMLSKIFDFNEAVVKNVMTPKKDVVLIDINAGFDVILDKVLESGYSRFPVYRDNPDNIIGIINMKDLLNLSFNKDLVVFQDIVYPATIVSDSKKITEILKDFQKGHTHLAIVADSQGKVEGIITLEDLLEEIVGEIEDEHDVRANHRKTVPAHPKMI